MTFSVVRGKVGSERELGTLHRSILRMRWQTFILLVRSAMTDAPVVALNFTRY